MNRRLNELQLAQLKKKCAQIATQLMSAHNVQHCYQRVDVDESQQQAASGSRHLAILKLCRALYSTAQLSSPMQIVEKLESNIASLLLLLHLLTSDLAFSFYILFRLSSYHLACIKVCSKSIYIYFYFIVCTYSNFLYFIIIFCIINNFIIVLYFILLYSFVSCSVYVLRSRFFFF